MLDSHMLVSHMLVSQLLGSLLLLLTLSPMSQLSRVLLTPAKVATEVTAHAVPVAVGYHGFGFYG